ncbi:uncharacterized protein ASPGLDRAFT_940186 [Aspergillus glaucus CBS 516.65]|uniref:Uncharacterized protein n=1 Tax=Aspergillus glaucus CBS 516.65 TaxID=1160497 RepID=A0A1L9V758_ASPGL|nr:hypothetical protein ASPGLDRAFT_940186 [Aspergillus glaucus CBS 516.65]OJJ79753.1 hypothetical protein ASPGLDRAFT_940186 [Aspergillus glaucus CBS 516.65]
MSWKSKSTDADAVLTHASPRGGSIHLEQRSRDSDRGRAGRGAADRRARRSREAELALLEESRGARGSARRGSSARRGDVDGAVLALLEERRAGRSSARRGSGARGGSGVEVVRRGRREGRVLALVDGRAGGSGGRGGRGRGEDLTLVDGGGAAGGGRRGAAELALEDDGRAGGNNRRRGSSRARQLDGSGRTSEHLRLRKGDSSAEETSESETGELHFVDVVVIWMVTLDKI